MSHFETQIYKLDLRRQRCQSDPQMRFFFSTQDQLVEVVSNIICSGVETSGWIDWTLLLAGDGKSSSSGLRYGQENSNLDSMMTWFLGSQLPDRVSSSWESGWQW